MRWVFEEGPAEMAGEVGFEESAWCMTVADGGGRKRAGVEVALFRCKRCGLKIGRAHV